MPKSDAEVKAAVKELANLMPTDDEKPGCWAFFVTFTVAVGLIFPLAYLRGWVALKLWDWFAAPIWPSIHLTVYTAVGFMFLLTAFRHHVNFKPDDNAGLAKAWANMVAAVVGPLALLGGAWIWTWLQWGA